MFEYPGRISAVSYLNTVPFIYGLEHAGHMRAGLILSPPSRCVTAYNAGEADIALVPTGALPEITDGNIVTGYCIGANGPVRTVTLMSDSPPGGIERIWLDAHSRTSVVLVKILCREFWHIDPEFLPLDDYGRIGQAQPGDGFLLIGDKVFDYEGRFRHTDDLAVCWQRFTGLPFVFAVWIARDTVREEAIDALGEALRYGTAHIPEAVAYYGHSGKPYAVSYLTENIDFHLDEPKRRALGLFLEKGKGL